jgi:hypothetical protein
MESHLETRRRSVQHDSVPMLDLRPFIGGTCVDPRSQNVLPVIDPMRGLPSTLIPLATSADGDATVHASRQAFDLRMWRKLHFRYLFRLAQPLSRNRKPLAHLVAAESRKGSGPGFEGSEPFLVKKTSIHTY